MSKDEIFKLTMIDHWFLDQIEQIVDLWLDLAKNPAPDETRWRLAKQWGFTDLQIGNAVGMTAGAVRAQCEHFGDAGSCRVCY